MKTTAIESPYAGDVKENLKYLDECIRDCLNRGESPYASHKMLTTALDDDDPAERKTGIEAGIAMAVKLDVRAFYVDRGWSNGMKAARAYYDKYIIPYEIRSVVGKRVRDDARDALSEAEFRGYISDVVRKRLYMGEWHIAESSDEGENDK